MAHRLRSNNRPPGPTGVQLLNVFTGMRARWPTPVSSTSVRSCVQMT